MDNKTIAITLRFWTNDLSVSVPLEAKAVCWDSGMAVIEKNEEKGIKAMTSAFNCIEDILPAIKELFRENYVLMVSSSKKPRTQAKRMQWLLRMEVTFGMIQKESKMKWRRYRFYTRSVEDYRPLKFNPKYPWWCSGYAGDGSHAVIIAYLPANENLKEYWDDAFEIDFTEEDKIEFSDRFPKPDYFKE